MPTCPKCQSAECRKDGTNKGKQRYFCKHCGYRHTVSYTHRGYSEEVKRMALKMYLEGLGFRSIARVLNCSHVVVYQWVKRYGEKASLEMSATELQVVEMDEMHTYIGSKKTPVGYGLPLTD